MCLSVHDKDKAKDKIDDMNKTILQFLNSSQIDDEHIVDAFKEAKYIPGIGSIKAMLQLTGYMMLVSPLVSLWGTVNKGTSGIYKFFTKCSREGDKLTDKQAKDYFNTLLLKVQRYHDKTSKNHIWNVVAVK